MAESRRRSQTARGTILVAGGLVVLKSAVWLATDSSGVLGSALDSLLDVFASLLVLWAVLAAERPADADHPWGHGKAEGLASLFQSFVIGASGIGLGFDSWGRFRDPGEALERPFLGMAAMVVSTLVTLWWVRRLRSAARETGSPALQADSAHYTSDVLLNGSVIGGLGLSTLLGGVRWPDLAVALGIAVLILSTAVQVLRTGLRQLMDEGLRPGEAAAILQVVSGFSPRVLGFHDLRTRRSGPEVFLEIHLDLSRELSFPESHDLGERVGQAIEAAVPRSRVTVHADPL